MNIRRSDGFALIDVIFAAGIIALLCGIALPRLVTARQSAGAASAIGSLRAISSAELTFALTCGAGFYAPDLPTLGTAPPTSTEAFISANLTGSTIVTRSGYTITLEATSYAGAPESCNGLAAGEAGQAYKAGADPLVPDLPRYFATNANGQIFEHTATLFAAMPEVGEPAIGHLLR